MTDEPRPFVKLAMDAVAVGQEWGVSPETTGLLMALMLLALDEGFTDGAKSLGWLTEQGYLTRNEGVPFDDPAAFEITPEGVEAAKRRIGVE